MPYRTELICPVCNSVMDTITHVDEKLPGMIESMLGGDARRDHASTSPQCFGAPGWGRGWGTKPLGFFQEDAGKSTHIDQSEQIGVGIPERICLNCKHWDRPAQPEYDGTYGDCRLITLKNKREKDDAGIPAPGGKAYAQDAHDYTARVCCEGDFGCLLWEQRS